MRDQIIWCDEAAEEGACSCCNNDAECMDKILNSQNF